jgi:hypothetical protein
MKDAMLLGVTEAIYENFYIGLRGKRDKFVYISHNEGLLEGFISHVLDFVCHFVRSKKTKKAHGDSLRTFHDAKVGVENDVSGAFLRIDGSR